MQPSGSCWCRTSDKPVRQNVVKKPPVFIDGDGGLPNMEVWIMPWYIFGSLCSLWGSALLRPMNGVSSIPTSWNGSERTFILGRIKASRLMTQEHYRWAAPSLQMTLSSATTRCCDSQLTTAPYISITSFHAEKVEIARSNCHVPIDPWCPWYQCPGNALLIQTDKYHL